MGGTEPGGSDVARDDEDRAVRGMQQHRLFAGLPRDLLADMIAAGHVRAYRSNSYVTMQGDASDEVFLLLEGRLEISTASPASRPQLRSVLEPVRLFGELGVLAETERTASVLCMEDSRVWVLEREPFVSLLAAQPALALGMLSALARQVVSKETLAADLVWLDLKGRLAKRLLQLATPAGGEAPPVVPPITQADLASLCGVTRESISKTLASFGRRGLVRRDGHGYVLLDMATLERLAGG